MQTETEVVSLKIDFKIDDRRVLRIIDIGDGMGADDQGFNSEHVNAKMLKYMHEATGAAITTLFGELPYDMMQPEAMDLPLVLRPVRETESALDGHDLLSHEERLLPCCERGRFTSYASYIWGKTRNTVVTPIGLVSTEMHKMLWYILMDMHMPADKQEPIAYWKNDMDPATLDLTTINIQHGAFIKIADRSIGGGDDVHYACDERALRKKLATLHSTYHSSHEAFKKHVYIIEPAYVTLKEHKRQNYNVTGRAFLTLIYNKTTQELDVKIAGAKWMFPLAPLGSKLNQDQMLSNIKHSIMMKDLNADELERLTANILTNYNTVFRSGFDHDNLMEYGMAHPKMPLFLDCFRPNASYKAFLTVEPQSKKQQLEIQMHVLFQRDVFQSESSTLKLLKARSEDVISFFSRKTDLNEIIKDICYFSFIENYIQFSINASDLSKGMFPFIEVLISQKRDVTTTLNKLILRYLALSDSKFDKTDLNRALRQASSVCNITVMKLLIYTRRADVNAVSPSNQTAFTQAQASANPNKEQALRLLTQAGAKIPEPVITPIDPASNRTCPI